MAINHYQLLGIPEDADSRLIKTAYRSMAKRFHPDTNRGSEAAAELFRQLNEAYRILSDEQLRKLYDRKISVPKAPQPAPASRANKTTKADPQQKFNRFINSVLEAIFETPDSSPEEPPKGRASPAQKPPRKVRNKPDFNFYYYLARERNSSNYRCDEDGIYRRNKDQKPNAFAGTPGGTVIMLLLTGLWEFFRH